jgi:hypothetical protein
MFFKNGKLSSDYSDALDITQEDVTRFFTDSSSSLNDVLKNYYGAKLAFDSYGNILSLNLGEKTIQFDLNDENDKDLAWDIALAVIAPQRIQKSSGSIQSLVQDDAPDMYAITFTSLKVIAFLSFFSNGLNDFLFRATSTILISLLRQQFFWIVLLTYPLENFQNSTMIELEYNPSELRLTLPRTTISMPCPSTIWIPLFSLTYTFEINLLSRFLKLAKNYLSQLAYFVLHHMEFPSISSRLPIHQYQVLQITRW